MFHGGTVSSKLAPEHWLICLRRWLCVGLGQEMGPNDKMVCLIRLVSECREESRSQCCPGRSHSTSVEQDPHVQSRLFCDDMAFQVVNKNVGCFVMEHLCDSNHAFKECPRIEPNDLPLFSASSSRRSAPIWITRV